MSNRADFLDMREQEAINNPQNEQRPVEAEEKPVIISALERRANAYLNKVRQNKLDKYENVDFEKVGKSDFSGMDFNTGFIGPMPLTAFQKLHFIPETSQETKDINIKKIHDGFKALRNKSRSI